MKAQDIESEIKFMYNELIKDMKIINHVSVLQSKEGSLDVEPLIKMFEEDIIN